MIGRKNLNMVIFLLIILIFIISMCAFLNTMLNDKIKPDIELKGDVTQTVLVGDNYKESGFVATDNKDGDITDKVTVKNQVDTSKTGVYKIRYEVKDRAGNKKIVSRKVIVVDETMRVSVTSVNGMTYVNGVLLVNKGHGLPPDYNPGVNEEAFKMLKLMQADGAALGLDLRMVSGYRSYETQKELHEYYVLKSGLEVAETFSAKPGYSEHQTGLAFDLGWADESFANTNEAVWLEENAYLYGFIIRYPKDKQDVTGYVYEPWHVRYLGVELATKVKESGLTLEEYLGV